MQRAPLMARALAAGVIAAGAACAGWDNPTALNDLQLTLEQELSVADIETFTTIPIEIAVEGLQGHVTMDDAMLELDHPTAGPMQLTLTRDGEHYQAMATFVAPGEYHAHVMGTPRGHALRAELGEFEFTVHHRHIIIGAWRVELSFESLPTAVPADAHLLLTISDTAGGPAAGLAVAGEVHDPDDMETVLTFEDLGDGTYEAEIRLSAWGEYELHLTIEGVEGELHLVLPDPDRGAEDGHEEDTMGGGHGH